MKIGLTKHARKRAEVRFSDLSEQDLGKMAGLVIKCGKILPSRNGCSRYRFCGKTFVIDRHGEHPVVVTVF